MAGRGISRKKVVDGMKVLGVYKVEFEPIIGIYCGLQKQYDALFKIFEDSGFQYWESTENGTKKAPIVTTLETLRKDILTYAAQLGLTVQGLGRLDGNAFAQKGSSALDGILSGLEHNK